MNVECPASRIGKAPVAFLWTDLTHHRLSRLYLQEASPAIGRGLEIGNAAAGYCLVTGKPTFACDTTLYFRSAIGIASSIFLLPTLKRILCIVAPSVITVHASPTGRFCVRAIPASAEKRSIFRSAKGRIGEPDGFTRRLPRSYTPCFMKPFSCSPLIFLVCKEIVALPQPKLIFGWRPSASASSPTS